MLDNLTLADLQIIWFILVGVLFSGYAILDGFDLGTGALQLFIKGDENRRLTKCRGPRMGRKRSLAHHGRRRPLRRLSVRVRFRLLRILPGLHAPAAHPYLPRRVH